MPPATAAPATPPSAPGNGAAGRAFGSPRVAAAFRSAISDLLSRQQFASNHNLTFAGLRDLDTALGYPSKLTIADYRHRYERGGIAARIVETYPEATWAGGAAIIEDPDPNVETEFEKEVATLFDRLEVWSKLLRADILAGLGRYAVLLIGDGGELSTELSRMNSSDAILYLTPLAEDNAKIEKISEDEQDRRFGLPITYKVRLGSAVSADGNQTRTRTIEKVAHWSRIIHIADGLLEDEVYGTPRLRSVWNYLNDLTKVVGGGSEAAWNRMDPGMQLDYSPKDPSTELTAAELEELQEQVEDYRHKLQRNLYTRDVDLTPLTTSVAAFGGNAKSILELIAGTSEIPLRILIGSERGELSSDQDEDNFNAKAFKRRGRFATPVVNLLVSRLVEYGALPLPKQYEVVWPEEEELTEAEKSEVVSQLAAANKAQADAEGAVILSAAEIRDRIYDMEPLIAEAVPGNDTEKIDDDADSDSGSDSDSDSNSAIKNLAPPLRSAILDQRILIIGGPRRGKSTLAQSYRAQGIPTYCTDPRSLVKQTEDGVIYLPENLDWSASSQYVADNWLTMPGPWCVEGIAAARAVRKLVKAGKANILDGVDIIVIENAVDGVEITSGQEAAAKSVMTVWAEIAENFPQSRWLAKVKSNQTNKNSVIRQAKLATASSKQRHLVSRAKLPRSGRSGHPIIKAW